LVYWLECPTETKDYSITSQAWSDYQIMEGLHWQVKGAANYYASNYYTFRPNIFFEQIYRPPHGDGYQASWNDLTKSNSQTVYTNLQTQIDYSKTFGDHSIAAMVGYSNEENNASSLSGYRKGYTSDLTPELNAGSGNGQTNSGTSTAWAMQAFFGRLNYSFMNRYLFEANMRYDGTSRLPSGRRWGAFPSFSAGWRISEESFMSSTKSWLSNLKLRGSWGKLGNQNIGLYPYQAMLSFTNSYAFDNSTLTQGVAQTALNNYNIAWETTTSTDLGIDIGLYNKLFISFDVYKKLTTDILRSAQVNALIGLTAPTINNGDLQNVGYDLDIKYQNQVKDGALKGLTYSIGANASGFKNKLVKFGKTEDGGNYIREEGRPYNTFYLLQVEGIFNSQKEIDNWPKQFGERTMPGTLKYKDANGDGVINNDDRVPMEDGVFPKCTYGLNISAEWKGFDLYGFFQGVAGSKVIVTGWGIQPFTQGSAPTKDQFKNAWTPENLSQKYVMLGDPMSFNHGSTYLLKDNSYFRLKTLQIGYSLPKNVISILGLSRFRLYFSGDNLLTATKYPGLDPERSGSGNLVSYPQNKVISFGCNIEF